MKVTEREYDIVVIGAGGAGLRAAISAREKSRALKIALLVKGELGKCGCTALSCSDRMAFHATLPQTEPGGRDNWRYHAEDIYRIGGEVSDGDLAEILARNSGPAFEYLANLGVPFVRRSDGLPDQFVTDGSKYARACYTGPHTANDIEKALVKKIRTLKVDIFEDTMAIDLIKDRNAQRIAAVLTYRKGGLVLFRAKATILATGGAGGCYEVTCFPEGLTGDGYAMAFRAGAEVVNLEFIQIGLSSLKTALACSGSIMRSLPRFINSEGREFLSEYFPKNSSASDIYNTEFRKGASWPVSLEEKSHIIDIAVFKENAKNRKVFLDFSKNPEGLNLGDLNSDIKNWYALEKRVDITGAGTSIKESPLARLREINQPSLIWLKERGIDLAAGDRIEVAPAIQHFQGGVKIDRTAATTIKGLFAGGECAGGQHGANRPGGNALMDSQVFGEIAGLAAARFSAANRLAEIDSDGLEKLKMEIEKLSRKGKRGATRAGCEARSLMSRCGSVVRVAEKIREGKERLRKLQREGISLDERGMKSLLETRNIVEVAGLILSAAAARKESRGPHLFFDSPETLIPRARDDKRWKKYVVLKKKDDNIAIEVRVPKRLVPNVRSY